MYLLLTLTSPIARCIFGASLCIEWVSSWLLRTRVTDVNRFFIMLNSLAVKILLVLRLRAIWSKDFIGERAKNIKWTYYIDLFWILVTLILYFITAGMFCRIRILIDRDDWWSELADVLVGFEDNMILNLPTDHVFQSAMSVLIIDVYLQSVSGALVPLHSCWVNPTHLYNTQHSLNSAFAYVF